MAGGDALGSQHQRVIQKRLELDLLVAQHIRVRCAPRFVLRKEIAKDAVPVLGGEVDSIQGNTKAITDRARHFQVLFRTALIGGIVLFPVLHEEASDIVSRALQQQRRHGRVHATGYADDDLHKAEFY